MTSLLLYYVVCALASYYYKNRIVVTERSANRVNIVVSVCVKLGDEIDRQNGR